MNNPFDRLYESCNLCPRACGVNRLEGETGVCGETASIRVASACVHFGEEPPVTGKGGSGTVFFTGCTLGCRFCQNFQISHSGMGDNLTEEELASIFLRLQADGAENINLVTATHFSPGVLGAVKIAKDNGLSIPIVWNSSGYEEVDTLELIAAYVDIWLPDAKTFDERVAKELFSAADYPEKNRAALLFMAEHAIVEWHGDTLRKGMIVRHLILPGETSSTERILKWYKSALYGKALLSLMCQYIPIAGYSDVRDPDLKVDLGKYLTKDEYGDCLFLLDELGIQDGFIQEQCDDNEWKPDFSRRNPFPDKFAKPVWHYKD
jgi:putative pyruvate formate lyase activating enzyme